MAVARYKGVVDALASGIRAGRLPAGTQLPTHRQLAASEGIALVTASRVYAELEAMGLVSAEQGRGTFVRDLALPPGHGIEQPSLAPDAVDLNFNYPALPGQAELLRHALRDLAAAGDLEALLRYQPHAGRLRDRETVAGHLREAGLPGLSRERVLIVSGAQHGLTVTLMAALRPGDVVAVDALTYSGFKVLAQTLRLELAPLPADGEGPDLDALERLCDRRPVRAVYTIPTLHNPLGWVTGRPARDRLVSVARRHGLLLIEDASYAYLAGSAPPPLAALAPEVTVYVSGLSKSVATGLRIGFVVAPAALVPALERAIRATTWNTPVVTTAIACRWIEDGTVRRLEAAKRDDARVRQAIAREVLSGLPVTSHPSSYFGWLPLPEGARADRIAASLAAERVAVATAEPFAISAPAPQAVRLALGSTDLDSLRTTLGRVRAVVEADAYRLLGLCAGVLLSMATFALIHGAGDAGWYWHLVERELRQRGHDTLAPDLPCDDDSAGLAEYTDTVVAAIGDRRDLVVVAQSFGGFTAPLVADRVPARLLVLVAAMIPAPGEAPDDWSASTGFDAVMSEQAALYEGQDRVYQDVPPALASQARRHARPQSGTPGLRPWPLAAWPSVPTRVVACTEDRFFPAGFMRRVAAERLGVVPDEIAAGHAVALSRPGELAGLLCGYLAAL